MAVPWREKFDMTISLCYVGNRARVPGLDEEFERVGLPVDLRMWNVPSPHEDLVVRALARVVAAMRRSVGFRNSGFGHYRALKTAYELGVKRVLVIEDDVRFLKDLDALSNIVSNAPDVGVVLFDLLRAGRDSIDMIRGQLDATVKNGWSIPTDRPCSFACYGMDRPSMARFVELVEAAVAGRYPLYIVDHYIHAPHWSPALDPPIHVAWPLAAIQKSFTESPSNTNAVFHGGSADGQYSWYRELGVDLDRYAL